MRTVRRLFVLAMLAALAAAVFHVPLLRGVGRLLIRSVDPAPADMILVLAGDGTGNRILKAAGLASRGYAPKVAVSGPYHHYGIPESELAINFAVRRGYPKELFVPLPHVATSTEGEARMILPELRRMGVKKLLVVTSDYHTRRSASVYHRYAPDLEIRVTAAPDAEFRPEDWWKRREGQKRVFFEYWKSLAWMLGI